MKTIQTKYLLMLFVLVALVQLFVPLQMVFGRETILETGTAYKFKTMPIDPSDPFRGKYITLRYTMSRAVSQDSLWRNHNDVYVYLKNDSLGFAQVAQVSKTPLTIDNDYIIAEKRWFNNKTKTLTFNLPFNRFYMEESKAKPAEDAYRKAQQDSLPNNTYALVYVKDGKSVLKDVLINDISIADYVQRKLDKE